MKKVVWSLAVFVVIAAIAWWKFGGGDVAGMAPGKRGFGPPDVTTIRVEPGQIPIQVTLPGRTVAYRIAQIRPQASGIIQKRLFTEGAEVSAGQPLYQIDDSMYKAALESARAGLQQARATRHVAELKANRYKKLIGTQAISQQDYDDASAALQQARAGVAVAMSAVQTAQLNLTYTRVYAPIDGRIGRSLVTEGSLVTANQSQALAVITRLDPIYVDVEQASTENMKLRSRLGDVDNVRVTIVRDGAAVPYPEEGKLQFSDVTVQASTASVELRALFPNPEHRLLPGLFVKATLHLGDEDAIAVPQQVLSRKPDGSAYVWVVGKDNKVRQQAVTTERAVADQWVISSGLQAGDVLVLEGVQRLSPGIVVVPHGKAD